MLRLITPEYWRRLRAQNESIYKEVSYFKDQVHEARTEIARLDEKVSELSEEIRTRDSQLEQIRSNLKENFEKLSSETGALFTDRDKIDEDLQLAWKAILNVYSKTNQELPQEVIIKRRGT